MIDTITIRSPKISSEYLDFYQSRLVFRQAYDLKNKTNLYTFISGNLQGSWDSNISVKIDFYNSEYCEELGRPIKTIDYDFFSIVIELSIQKFMDGHNLGKGYDDLEKPLNLLFSLMEQEFNVKLPDYKEWQLTRIDIGYNFSMLPSGKFELFERYRFLKYPKRQTYQYNGTLYYAGTTTTVKIYDKGKEFRKHDLSKLKRIFPDYAKDTLYYLAQWADALIRCEVEFHKKKLKDLNIIFVKDFKKELFEEEYNKEVNKLFGTYKEKITNRSSDVLELLMRVENPRVARSVYSTWVMLSTMSLDHVKERISERTLYRHKKIMKENGIIWVDTDLEQLRCDLELVNQAIDADQEFHSDIPRDFNFYAYSKYRIQMIPDIPKFEI